MKYAFALPIIIVVILMSIGTGLYYFCIKNASNESTIWKTYKGNGYLVQYPSDLISVTPTDADFDPLIYLKDGNARVYFNFPTFDTLASSSGIFSTVYFDDSPQGTSTCGGIDEINGWTGSKLLAPISNVLVKENNFKTFRFGGCGGAYCFDVTQYSILHDGMCYRADLLIDSGMPLDPTTSGSLENTQTAIADARLHSLFDQMLLTFTFVP